ncbi:MAG: T9SS type A sorting domain-containing protein [Candidatus Kapaibacterium sp.]
MKKLYLLLGIMLCVISNYQITQALPCCSYITVVPQITDDCCIEIHVNNPYCSGAVVTLEINNGGSWSEVYKDSITQNPVIKYCPPGGSGLVEYRVKFTEPFKPGEPYCGGAGPYIEGFTMYSGSVYLECCEDCPEGYESWFNLESKKSNNCPDNGCEITHSLNIPDSIDCYTNYRVETDSSFTPILPLVSDSLFNINGCIAAGTTFNAKVILFTANGDSCIIEDSVFCDEPRDSTDLQEPCVPDCFGTPFGAPLTDNFMIAGCSGLCLVKVTYVSRKACGIWQDLQILKMELSQGCVGCSDSYIYQQALLGIIDLNRMGFTPTDSGCASTWRVTQGGCWSDWYYYVVNPTMGVIDTVRVLEPCTLTECCLQSMTVCKDPGPPKTITITYDSTYIPPSIDCEDTWLEDPLTGWITQCYPKCDWLTDLEGTDMQPPPPPLLGKKALEGEGESSSRIGIQMFQVNDHMQIQINNEGMSSVILKVMDILGKEMITVNQDINNGENIIRIPINGFTSGAYILTVIADDYLIKTEKFIIK